MNPRLAAYIERKVRLIEALDEGECGGTYADACLVASSTISGFASILWPGENCPDRKRFVQVWSDYATSNLGMNLVSVPLLLADLEMRSCHVEMEQLTAISPDPEGLDCLSRVVTGSEVDLPEHLIRASCPTVPVRDIRAQSYGNIFYKHVRSAYVHEYQISKHSDSISMASPGSGVSYTNVIRAPFRRIHFEASWLIQLIRVLATNIEPVIPNAPLPHPRPWWVDGG